MIRRTTKLRSSGAALASAAGRPCSAAAGRDGFTILEMLVALGAVALISIGLARIFGATGDTVRAGRRLSHFNDVSRSIERVLREDFSRMSRDGFLVIAHELTDGNISRYVNDRSARKRRIDQIMFFEQGQFRTLRPPVYPSRVASGAAARIWIGHGLRQEPGSPRPSVPPLDDINRDGNNSESGQRQDTAPWFGRPGPNQYASDWILMRHVAVLAEPKNTPPPRPQGLLFPTMDQWPDKDIQVDLAPAVSSLFRNIARGTPATKPPNSQIARPREMAVARPQFSSGIPDVVTTTLPEIRSIILDAQKIETANRAIEFDPAADGARANDPDGYEVTAIDGTRTWRFVPYAFQTDQTDEGALSCFNMKQWMLQALPAEPRTQTRMFAPDPPMPQPQSSPQFGGRMRVEPFPPDYLGTKANDGAVYVGDDEFRRSDQVMLASSAFAPACTEFIVEWTFGETYISDTDTSINSPGLQPDPFLNGPSDPRIDQLIWHGLDRYAEIDFIDGTDPQADRVAGPYFGQYKPRVGPTFPTAISPPRPLDAHYQPIRMANGRLTRPRPEGGRIVPPRVIHEPVDSRGLPDPVDGQPFYSLFGYVDPTFPSKPPTNQLEFDDAELRNSPPDTIPCEWPRLIRITMTLADPGDPTFEQTYQFIFEVPAARADNGG